MQTEEKNTAILCLTHAIEDAQGAIRAYDIKAEILAGLLAIVLGITSYNFIQQEFFCAELIIASWLVGLATILILGVVLYPKKNLFESISLGNYTPQGVYCLCNLSSSPQNNVENLAKKAVEADWIAELTYENMKLSVIRDRKHFWFIWALRLSGVSLVLIASSIVWLLKYV